MPDTTPLQIATELALPSNAVTQTIAFLGRKGSGKSYAAGLLCEQMLKLGMQVVVLDPVGVWYGLRLGRDGKSPGLPIPVFGGLHGDLALEVKAGAAIARLIVSMGLSAVLDVTLLRKNERKQFATDFAEEFFHLKKSTRSAVHLFVEECHVFAPQRLIRGEERMLGAFEDIVRLGRNYGIGASLISQRPQAINKEVLNQTECLFALQTTGPQEREAIATWIEDKRIPNQDIAGTLPYLEVGTAHVWSPQWLKLSEIIHFEQKQTYDASATPVFGEGVAIAPSMVTPIDLEAIRQALTVEDAVQTDDPQQLRQRILELEQALKQAQVAKAEPRSSAASTSGIKAYEAETLYALLQQAIALVEKIRPVTEFTIARTQAQSLPDQTSKTSTAAKVEAPPKAVVKAEPKVTASKVKLSAPQQRILNALLAFEKLGLRAVMRSHVAVFSDQSPKSGGYSNNLGSLRSQGLIDYPQDGYVTLTAQGIRSAHTSIQINSLHDLHVAWVNFIKQRSKPQALILSVLLNLKGQAIDRETLAHKTSQSPNSGGYSNNLGALRSLKIVDYPKPGYVAAARMLFPNLPERSK